MTENRIQITVESELQQSSDRQVGLQKEIDVKVRTELTPLALAGLTCIVVGVLLSLVAAVLFLLGFPDQWYARTVSLQDAQTLVTRVVLTWGFGVILLLTGSALFFHGKTVVGTGHADVIRVQEPLEVERVA